MRYDNLIIESDELLRDFREGLASIGEEDMSEPFIEETINFVLDYIAEMQTARGSLEEHIRETLDLYGTFDEVKQKTFKSILEAFCFEFYERIVESEAYLFGMLQAKFECFHGDDIVLRKMTQGEINAICITRDTGS